MIYVGHAYPEAPYYVSGSFRSKNDCSFLVVTQPPTIVELIDSDNNMKHYVVITNNYDDRLYPVT